DVHDGDRHDSRAAGRDGGITLAPRTRRVPDPSETPASCTATWRGAMTDPKRLLEGSSDLEQRLLRSWKADGPSKESTAAALAIVGAGTGAITAPPAAAVKAGIGAKIAASSAIVKVAGAGILVAAIGTAVGVTRGPWTSTGAPVVAAAQPTPIPAPQTD